jgi:hypothetical protein
MNVYEVQPKFSKLFAGLDTAFGTGKGQWVKRPPRPQDWCDHLEGKGPGMGIAPLRPDNSVMFAAIDLDEPDFEAAREMQKFIPGSSFVEHSRSGNAHVWVFFKAPLEAWVAMGILKEAVAGAGKKHVEVFPKNHDFAKVKLGNYINLPYFGDSRKVESNDEPRGPMGVSEFMLRAFESANDPEVWRTRANWLLISAPAERERTTEFGGQSTLHICAREIIENPDANPVVAGHRAIFFFNLAKALTNWNQIDHDEALMFMSQVNDASPDKVSESELSRILSNAERGGFTSTGCDDPVFAPYAHPSCPIAFPRS